MKLDAHQHFWAIDRGDYGWLTPDLGPIYRDFLPPDLAPILDRHEIEGTLLVQAAPTVEETHFLLSLARANPFIKGVVGWVDFESDNAEAQLDVLARDPNLLGIRPMIQDIAQVDWMLRPEFAPIYHAIIRNDLVFDALTLPQHLKTLYALALHQPDLRIVIDHGSKPHIASDEITEWAKDMRALASLDNVSCKLSGLVTEASADWSEADLKPYVDHLLDTFGPQRLIWGSDWPVCTLAASYDRWVHTCQSLLAHLSPDDRAAIFGGTAQKIYQIKA
jgi:L-fuconolactonase